MRVLAIQLHTDTGKVRQNYTRAFSLLELGATLYHPDVVLLPEAFAAWGASTDLTPFAEDVPGLTTATFCEYSQKYDAMIIFGLIRRDPQGEGLYNTAVLIDRGELLGLYDKTHLTMDHRPESRALKNEQELFLPGGRLGLFDTRFGKIGVLICHDGSYPEMWRCLALEGAKAIVWLMNCIDISSWARLHASWNTVPVFSCNRTLRMENGQRNGGGSIFVDVQGEPLDAAGTAESFVFADVNLEEQLRFRADGISPLANYFRVRRPDLYGPLCRRQ
jgi:N-carbamoylputrescine amidase